MAKDKTPSGSDSNWDRTMRLFQSGSSEFVEAVRQRINAVALAPFADTWYKDPRIEARKLLLSYLERPFNAARHEPLVKRLFKLADKAGDDAAMARFMFGFDRSIRRKRGTAALWNARSRSMEQVEVIYTPPDTTLSRDDRFYLGAWFVQNREKFTRGKHLFSVPTRQYLRRRAWRYFRKLGKQHPERYVSGVCTALKLYTDADVPDGLGLLDNWGLVHVLFHHSAALESTATGWYVSATGTLPQLQPDPMYRALWLRSPEPIFDLLVNGKCRPVCLWAAKMLRQHFPNRLALLSVEELLDWLVSDNSVLNDLAIEGLERAGGLEKIPVERWLSLMDRAKPDMLDRLCEMVAKAVKPEQVQFADAVRLAMQRPVPLARLGVAFLAGKKPTSAAEVQALFAFREAQADPLRADLVRWACKVLSEQLDFRPQWVLEFLDGRHEDVREVGWEWLQTEPRAREDIAVWQKMLESPYDNIRLRLIGILEERAKERTGLAKFSLEHVRFLWATVLLNISRGSRAKPFVVRQIIERIASHPDEAGELLPIIAVSLRSSRGPEFRAGLAGVAAFVERNPTRKGLVEAVFPELSWS